MTVQDFKWSSSFLISIFVFTIPVFLSGCDNNQSIEFEAPNENRPHFQYYKLGDNWIKLPSGSKYPDKNGSGMAQYIEGMPTEERLTKTVFENEFTALNLGRCCNDTVRAYYPNLFEDEYKYLNSEQTTKDPQFLGWSTAQLFSEFHPDGNTTVDRLLTGEKTLKDFNRDFYYVSSPNGGALSDTLISKKPLYFDQHIMLVGSSSLRDSNIPQRFVPRFIYTIPINGTGSIQLIQSSFPYFRADASRMLATQEMLSLQYEPDETVQAKMSTELVHRLKFVEEFVKETLIGTELPPEINK